MSEEWRDVPGFEGVYAVSDAGRVLSRERRCNTAGGTRRVRQRILTRPGRRVIKLSRPDEESEYCTPARLVLIAFVGQPKHGQVAHYKDGNEDNAALVNVEWSSFSKIAVEVGYKPPRGNRK